MTITRRELLAAGAASLVPPLGARAGTTPSQTGTRTGPAAAPARGAFPPNLSIREYLVRESRAITGNSLSDLKTPADFKRHIGRRRREYMLMMGVADRFATDRGAVPFTVTGVIDRPTYRIEKLHYQSLPDLHVTANLYVPKSAAAGARMPAILYVCGHAQNQKVHYQAHPKRFAELGFVTLAAETVQLGEAAGFHHGPYREGWFHWYSRGYAPSAIEMFNGVRGLDLLAARADVDPDRLGVTGLSGGGAVTWWIAAADERVKCCSPVCGTATLESHIYDRVIDGHCDCMWWVNTSLWDLADVGALIAPRPLLIASSNQDGIFPIDSIRKVHSQLQALYRTAGNPEHVAFVETPGGHGYHEISRQAIFSWFVKHLMGKDVPPDSVGDIELDPEKLESATTLSVYAGHPPSRNRATTIQDEFLTVAEPPSIGGLDAIASTRKGIADRLRADTFNHFPRNPPPLAVVEEFALDGGTGTRLAFTSEDGWRLHGLRRNPAGTTGAVPAVVVLRSPGEARNASDEFAGRIRAPWTKVVVEPRGTGDTSWGEDLNWHVRRASAWTGRTIASMRVWDALRAIEAVRTLPGIDPARMAIAAAGEMGAIALYAALLDGRLTHVLLDSPPATQNAASEKDGRGPALEMLNCLRYTDLPHVAGLLHPAQVVLAGNVPSSYEWAETLYRRLNAADSFRRVSTLQQWQPGS